MDQDPTLADDLRIILTTFKSRLNELLLAKGANLTSAQTEVGKAFERFEGFLWKWDWDLRGNYVRSGKVCPPHAHATPVDTAHSYHLLYNETDGPYQITLEDGETIDASLTEFEAEDERGEYAPQVIELDEQGREIGLYSL